MRRKMLSLLCVTFAAGCVTGGIEESRVSSEVDGGFRIVAEDDDAVGLERELREEAAAFCVSRGGALVSTELDRRVVYRSTLALHRVALSFRCE